MLADIKKLLYVIFLTFFCFGCNSKQSAQESKEKLDSISKESTNQKEVDIVSFVLNFYKIYSPYDLGRDNENKLSDFLLKNGDEFLTNNLKLLILEDIKCTEEGYVCNLDMDPFYNSQDKIILSNALTQDDKSVDVFFDNKSKLTILLNCNDKCLISNVIYPDGSNLEEKLKQKD
ncbi:hypothetical protein [Acinetobacter calcoaceticus]|uniref:hypothetical protein n=1 Tax=Acinetobacter calcoaceticus TaxID=471 RepID=UPI001E436A27|nr:hypothetical protein [Acinetobacter calcoaceticus]UGQ29993.1 hypothetical protein LRO84_00600 [Acinetobacter calcoaceticus]